MDIVEQLVKVALLGATWVLYVMFALSVLAVAAMVERWWFYRGNARQAAAFTPALLTVLQDGDEHDVADVLARGRGVEAEVLADAFAFREGGPEAFADAIDSALGARRGRLDRSTTLLGTIGNNAPFVGLFGTVLGVIEAFSYLGAGDASAMGNVMSGIAEALVATAVGIFVAIPSVVGFNLAQKKSGEIETSVGVLAKRLSAWLRVQARRS
ncbi:MAG TPA: MotA/TolQ/ExbB proton channel family protein [Nannocystaceae bacterium]|nr:MotA/TolQ/ExbB proton channel family protein [Nannocystaceae bacterium]